MTYQEYLLSKDWQQKRAQKLRESKRRCTVCSTSKQLDVHHPIYRNWTDVRMSDLRVVCRRCHEIIHSLLDRHELIYLNDDSTARFLLTRRLVRGVLLTGDWQEYAPRWFVAKRHERLSIEYRLGEQVMPTIDDMACLPPPEE